MESKPSTIFLYVAFNQSMVMAANEMFQLSNVECKTFHSIAHSAVMYVTEHNCIIDYNGASRPGLGQALKWLCLKVL